MHNVDGITVHLNGELAEVLSILDKEVEKKIVLVVDEKQRLHGTITDGDVRRALLNGASTKSLASEVMFKDFKFVRSNTSDNELKRFFIENQIQQLPEIDESGCLIGIHLLHELKQGERKDTPVVIMAGGLGSRLSPLTDNCPKPMLEVGGKPILELIIDGLKKQGFYQFFIAVNYLSEQISDYFGNGEKFSIQIEYIREKKRLGTAGALSLLPCQDNFFSAIGQRCAWPRPIYRHATIDRRIGFVSDNRIAVVRYDDADINGDRIAAIIADDKAK